MKISRLLTMLAILVGSLAVWPAAAHAVSVLMPADNQYPPLSIKSNLVDVRIDGPVARTHISQVFHNPHPRDLEATFVISLPKNAQVTDFVMTINGEEVHAQALESAEARAIYTSIVRRMKDPGLLEFVDHQTFRVRVFPVPREGDMPIELSYAQPLRREGDLFAFDFGSEMAAGSREVDEANFSAVINWDDRLGTIYSPTHKLDIERSADGRRADIEAVDFRPEENRDLTLLFAPEETGVGIHLVTHRPDKHEPGTFLLMIHPPADGALAEPVPKTVTFVLDVSGSMNEAGKIDKAKAALIQCLGALGPDDKFTILTFETGTDAFPASPAAATEENLAAARNYVEKIRARGGTNFHKAMMQALEQSGGDDELHQIVVMTDGLPTVGVTDPDQILRAIKSKNNSDLRIFSLGVGFDVNTHLLDAVSGETRALSAYVKPGEDLELKVANFFDSVAYPVLTNLALEIPGVDAFDVYPLELPDLFKGQDLTVFGRYRDGDESKIRLTGLAGGDECDVTRKVEFANETDDETAYIAALWANRKAGYLLDQIRLNGENDELRESVIELAEEYNLVTPYTSFLVADDSDFELAEAPARSAQTRGQGIRFEVDRGSAQPLGGAAQDAGYSPMSQRMAAPALGSAPAGSSGKAAVQLSEKLSERKKATRLGQVGGRDRDAAIRKIAGATFVFDGKSWVQNDIPKDATELKIKYLSDAYFELLERFPDQKPAMLLGDQVTLVLAGHKVIIGEEGIEKVSELPEALR